MRRALVLLALLAACGKRGDGGTADPRPEPIPADEVKRGDIACRDLAERTCRCAAGKPELATACEEARALPDALRMSVQAAEGGGLQDSVRARLQYDARRTIARCLEDINKLAALGCR